jgi:type 2 lantibiotic biosynthesis protein LanM
VPTLHDAPLRLDQYAEEVLDGFRQMYRFLLDHRTDLLAPESPLYGLADQEVRFVHRATRVYGLLLRKLADPVYLRDGADRGIQLELLTRAFLEPEERPPLWPVLAAEQRAMERADVPFFTARAGSDALETLPGQTIAGCFAEPSFERVLGRLRALGEEDLGYQVSFIEGLLYAHAAREAGAPPPATIAIEAGPDGPPTTARLLASAIAIAEEIAARAIRAEDGSAAWIGPRYLTQSERYQFEPTGFDLYGGASGIALFLAAVDELAAGDGYHELALGALQPLRQTLRTHPHRVGRQLGIGGAAGLGGVVYALVRAARLLDNPALLDDADRAAALITAERIAADRTLDVIGGAAGAILGLLALHEVSGATDVLERASACGQHLLGSRTTGATGHRAWSTISGKLLTGFSHGAAGVAYALLRLHAVAPNPDLQAAASEGIAYEDSVFSPEVGSWPDFRPDDAPGFPVRWCHGAAGIGLARLGGLAVLDTPEIRRDVEIAVEATRRSGLGSIDHLCCGDLGRADTLLEAAGRLDRPELLESARLLAWRVVSRAERRGAFALHPLLPTTVYSPSLFQGTAGIGYELLRLAHPDRLPSLLLWE